MQQQVARTDIAQLQQKVERLEKDVRLLEGMLKRVLVSAPPVMFTMPDGSKRPFKPNKPMSLQVLAVMLEVAKLPPESMDLTDEQGVERLRAILETGRQEAVRQGTAIDDEREAAQDD